MIFAKIRNKNEKKKGNVNIFTLFNNKKNRCWIPCSMEEGVSKMTHPHYYAI